MQTFSTETGIIRSIEDFFPYLQFIVQRLIEGELEALANKGYAQLRVLQTIVFKERQDHHRACQISEETPPGLYWFVVPPDHALEEALVEAHCSYFDESSDIFIERCQSLINEDGTYEFSFRDVLDGQNPLLTSKWHIELPMWNQNGETQLTLRLQVKINDGNPSFSIMDLEVM